MGRQLRSSSSRSTAPDIRAAAISLRFFADRLLARAAHVCVESGWRLHAAAVDPETALYRGLILFAVASKVRDIAPSKRKWIGEHLEDELA